MADISVIEFGVYAFFAYSSVLMLIISTIKEMPATRALASLRAMFMIPGAFCAAILSNVGINIVFPTTITNSTTYVINGSTGAHITNSTTITLEGVKNLLVNPVWVYFHGLLAAILIVFVIFQVLQILTKPE